MCGLDSFYVGRSRSRSDAEVLDVEVLDVEMLDVEVLDVAVAPGFFFLRSMTSPRSPGPSSPAVVLGLGAPFRETVSSLRMEVSRSLPSLPAFLLSFSRADSR